MPIIIDFYIAIKNFYTNCVILIQFKHILLETSLIGKALNFGFNEYGFESHVSNMTYNYAYAYVINLININAAKKKLSFDIRFTKKTYELLSVFKKTGVVLNFYIRTPANKRPLIRVYICYYKDLPLGKNIKLLTKPSKSFHISVGALKLLEKRTGNSIFILSTSRGLITHKEALNNQIGGVVVGFFSI